MADLVLELDAEEALLLLSLVTFEVHELSLYYPPSHEAHRVSQSLKAKLIGN